MPHQVRVKVDAFDVMSSGYPNLPVSIDWTSEIVIGSSSDEADSAVLLSYTIAGSGTQDIDLTALTGAAGQTISLTELHLIVAIGGTADRFTLTPHATNGFTGLGAAYSVPVHRAPVLAYHRPSGVTITSTDKVITITNTESAAGTIKLLLVGRD